MYSFLGRQRIAMRLECLTQVMRDAIFLTIAELPDYLHSGIRE